MYYSYVSCNNSSVCTLPAPPLDTAQVTEKALSAELDKQRKRVAGVHSRLAGHAGICLNGITATRPGMSLFVQHCILPRITYSAEVRAVVDRSAALQPAARYTCMELVCFSFTSLNWRGNLNELTETCNSLVVWQKHTLALAKVSISTEAA